MEEIKQQEQELLKAVNMKIDEATKDKADSIELKELKNELENNVKSVKDFNEAISDLKKNQEEIGIELKKITEVPDLGAKKIKSLEDIMDEHSEQIKMLKSGEIRNLTLKGSADAVFKATHASSDITTASDFAMMLPGVGKIPQPSNFMMSIIPVRSIDREYWKYVDQNSVVRDAKNVAGCAPTTHLTKVDFQTYTEQVQKIRDWTKVCIDMFEDYSFMRGEIEELINGSLQAKINEQLLTGDGIAPNLNGIASIASTFSAANVDANVEDVVAGTPTTADVVNIVASQIAMLGQKSAWNATHVIMSCKDALIMRMTKDPDGRFLEESLGNITVIESNLVADNTMYVGDFSKAVIYQAHAAEIEYAFQNDTDFEQELATVKAYWRGQLHVRNVNANAFMFVSDIAAAKLALDSTQP